MFRRPKRVLFKLNKINSNGFSSVSETRMNESSRTKSLKLDGPSPEFPPNKATMECNRLVPKMFYKVALIFLGYVIASLNGSILLLAVITVMLLYLEKHDKKNVSKIKKKAAVSSYSKNDLIGKLDEIPSWVKFPDRERAEWLNQIIEQLWPTLNSYLVKHLRTSIQSKICRKYESFRFESIDFGTTPPKIDGIKVYNRATTTDSIIVDFDVFYDGDCDIGVSISGAEIGGIRNFQLNVEVRIVLKPLLLKLPLIGGLQVFFLNTPDINFTLDGLSSIPGLSSFIRSKIEEKITKKIVFPNKMTKRFCKSVAPSELKALEPGGVLRVHVFEAKDLMAKDLSGKSDPYAILYVGAQEFKSDVVNQDLNPKWDNWCEFIVIDPMAQHLGFKLFDRDNVNEDDFLGSGEIVISTVIKDSTDQWFKLENAKHGSLHLRFTWFSLSQNLNDLAAIQLETSLLKVDTLSTSILIVYIDMALNLPEAKHLIKPHPYFCITLGEQNYKSRVKKHTNNPSWEQGFVVLVPKPHQDSVLITILDKPTGNLLTQLSYKISNLLNEPNLEISKSEFEMADEQSRLVMSLQLRILTNSEYEIEDVESESESDDEIKEIVKEVVTSSNVRKNFSEPTIKQSPSFKVLGEYGLGRLELTIAYSQPRQKLLITVHQISDLPLKDPSDIPDPYVRIKICSMGHTTGPVNRTKVKMDCCNPVYEETFEYSFSKTDVYNLSVLATVKTKKFLYNNTIGQVEINLKYVSFDEPYRQWFDLYPKSN